MDNPTVLHTEWLKPSIHPSYARLLSAHLRNKGLATEDIFKGNSLDWDSLLKTQGFISFEQFRRLALNAIELTQCPWLGVEISSMIQVSAHGPLGYGAVASPTVKSAFELVEKAMATRIGLLDFELKIEGDRSHFLISELMDLGELSELIYLLLLGSFQDMLAKTSGRNPSDITVNFPFDCPPWLDRYKNHFPDLEMRFSCASFSIDLPSELLNTHCLTADEFAYRNAVRECDQLLAVQKGGGELSEQIKMRLFDVSGEYPSQDDVANEFGMSVRTLIRKLKSEHTSFQKLLDEVRKELACWYLQNEDQSIERIAERLGFVDTSNFSRVFRRWMGCTPSQFKRSA